MEDSNIDTRISKFNSVITAFVKGGIRFCHPLTIKQVFNRVAIPTLTNGLELCTLNDKLLNRLNTKSGKGLKALFNISGYSRNFLPNLMELEHVSTTIINNKLNLFSRLLHNAKTADILFKMFQYAQYDCFTTDICKISEKLGLNLTDIIITRR